MRVLATISDMKRLAVIVDLESGETRDIAVRPEFHDASVQGRPPCRPFGITWSSDEVFIVNNRQLLVFDRQLTFLRTSTTRLQINMHQLAYRPDRVWAVSPWTNSLIGVSSRPELDAVEFDLFGQVVRPYTIREATVAGDTCHFNSLLWSDGHLFVGAHTFGGASFINRYDGETLQLSKVHRDVGESIHGLAHCDDELFWMSTNTHEIRSDRGFRQPLPHRGYSRGFAMTDRYFIVATSERLARGERHTGDSWIQVIDRRRGTPLRAFHLPGSGSVNDLRLLDEYDYAHRIEPLWDTPIRPAGRTRAR